MSLVVALSFVFVASAQESKKEKEPVEVFTTGDRGTFDYKLTEYDYKTGKTVPSFSIMHKTQSGGMAGTVFGLITSTTTVSYLNSDMKGLTRKNLSLLHGKEVVVIARIRQEGVGEGSQTYCEDLKVLLVPGFNEY